MREIVTVQVGSFANFVGSHFWNFQDELLGLGADPNADSVFRNQCLDMDVLYRTGETNQGNVTYTPRMVSVDFQGSLGTMSSRGTLYSENSSSGSDILTWTGNLSTHSSEQCKKNLFLQRLSEEGQESSFQTNDLASGTEEKDIIESLENVVQYWTDYSKVHYHPRSLYELSGLWIEPRDFDSYGIGKDAFSGSLRGEEISERIRLFVEECDNMQGFQFVVDDSGGFSAIASDLLETIADEYGNTSVLLYSVRGTCPNLTLKSLKQTVSKDLHDAVSFSKLSSYCNLIVPIGLPSLSPSKAAKFLTINDEKPFHYSAVYGAAIHAATRPFLIERPGPTATSESGRVSGPTDINGLMQMLAYQARHNVVGIMDISLPAPCLTGTETDRTLLSSLHSLTPEIQDDVEDFQAVELISSLGAFSSGFSRATVREVKETIETGYRQAKSRPMVRHLSVTQCPLPIPLPFPSIFGDSVGRNGELLGNLLSSSSSSKGSLDVESVPVASRLRSSRAVLPYLEKRLLKLNRYGIERGGAGVQLLSSWGFGKEELQDMSESLERMVFALKPGSGSTSDDSD